MKKIIILLPEIIFLKRDYDRFGIEILKKNFSVSILDCIPWTNPIFWKNYSKDLYKTNEHVSISSKEDFLNFIDKIHSPIVIDCVGNNKKTVWLKKLLENKKSKFVYLKFGFFGGKMNFFQRLKVLFVNTKSLKKIIIKIYSFLTYKVPTINTSDICIVGGLAGLEKKSSKNIIEAHTLDYDQYLNIKNKVTVKSDPYVVFLDEDMPSHIDYTVLNASKPINEEEYYPTLIKFFKKFEKDTNFKVKFSIHPKSPNKNYKKLLEGIDYSIGNTAELVKDSSGVLLHASTSISYAILFKKPALFLTSNKLKKCRLGHTIENFPKLLNSSIINIDSNLNTRLEAASLFKIDEKRYKNYKDQYLKVPNSQDLPVWEIFTQYIKMNQF